MGARAEATGIEIPPHVLHGDAAGLNLVDKLVIVFLAHASANDFANLREQHVGALYGLFHLLSVEDGLLFVNLHVESLYLLGVVGHDDRLLEVFLHKVALVLGSKVVAPIAGELELLLALGNSLLKDFDALGVRQAYEGFLQHTLKALDESLVNHLVEELEVVLAVVQCPTHAILDEVFLKVHEVVQVDEASFGLHHPKLGKVARCVAVLGTEGGTEGVDGSQGGGAKLALELTAHGEACLLAEEVVRIDDASVLVLLQVIEVLGGHLEHLSRTLAVACSDEGGVEIEVAMLMEIGMDSHRHVVADTHYGTECVGAQAHVGMLAHILEGLSLLLHGIVGAAGAQHLNLSGLNLACLTGSGAFHQLARYGKAGAGGNLLEHVGVEVCLVAYNLYVLDGGAVIEGNEEDALAATLAAHPSVDKDVRTEIGTKERIGYFCSFHFSVS